MSFRPRLPVAALLATAALAGCGADGSGILGGAGSDEPNATDAAFARAMVAHERTIGAIAQLGSRKALRKELRTIARTTLARNDQHLRGLVELIRDLRDRGVSPIGANIGEPPPFDPRALRDAVSFDHDFLERMIRQHEYAMTTAAAERDRGGDRRLKALARTIYESSRRDLETLRRWLRTWYGEDTQRGVPPLPPPGGGRGGQSPGPPV